MSAANLGPVFDTLAGVLRPFAKKLVTKHDGDAQLYLDCARPGPNGQPMFFAAVRLGKRYVSYYLMPVYVAPELVANISPALKKRMQGKSCFNFTAVDPALVEELTSLTKAGFEAFRRLGYVS